MGATVFSGLSNKWENLTPRQKVIVGIGVVSAIFVVPALILYVYHSIFSATITLTFAPKSATVRIGNAGGSFGDNAVKPGKYEVVISKKGFETYKETVSVAAGRTVLVEAALESNDPSTANWYQEHEEDYSISQGIGDRRADRAYMKMMNAFPVAEILPIIGLYSTYRIDYGISPTDSNSYAIFISFETEEYKQQAMDLIESKGYDLKDYEVIYKQDEPIVFDSVGVAGASAFSKRGLSAENVNTIQEALVAQYKNEQVSSITISDNVSHVISDDKLTDTYIATMTLNSTNERRLTVAIRDNRLTISASAPDGSSVTTLYDGVSK